MDDRLSAQDRQRSAVVALLTVQVLFGIFPVAAKKVMIPGGALEPFSLLALRVGGAAFCLLALHLVLVRKPIPILTEWPKVLGLAMLGVVLNMGMFMVGLQFTTPTEAVLVITSIPVFTYAIAVVLGRESIGPRRVAGIVLALAGVLVLTAQAAAQGRAHLFGDLLILGNALSYAAFLVLAKPIIHKYDPLSLTTWVFLVGAVVFIPIGLAGGLRGQVAEMSSESVWWMVFIVLGPSVLTYVLNTVALRHVHSSTVAAFTYVQPLFTALFSYWILAQPLNPRLLPAAALVFAGVWLVARAHPKILEGTVAAD